MTSTPVPPNKKKTADAPGAGPPSRKAPKPSGNVYRTRPRRTASKDAAGRSRHRRYFLPLFIVWLTVVGALAGLIYWGLRESSKPAVPAKAVPAKAAPAMTASGTTASGKAGSARTASPRTGTQKKETSVAQPPAAAQSAATLPDPTQNNAVRAQPPASAPQKAQTAHPPSSTASTSVRAEIPAPPQRESEKASRTPAPPSPSPSQPSQAPPDASEAMQARPSAPPQPSAPAPSVPAKQPLPPAREKEDRQDKPGQLLALSIPPAVPGKPKVPSPPDLAPSMGRVAIVIDDLGQDLSAARRLMEIPVPITFSVLPFLSHSLETAKMASAGGREVIVHLPMEPKEYPKTNPGAGALLLSMSTGEILRKLTDVLDSNPYADGVNNHMGSGFTERKEAMETVLSELKRRELFFLDSFTSPASVGYSLAGRMKMPAGKRDIFLDHVPNERFVRSQLEQLVRKAKIQGSAIAIGHPHECTLRVLSREAPQLRQKGITVVPLRNLLNGSN